MCYRVQQPYQSYKSFELVNLGVIGKSLPRVFSRIATPFPRTWDWYSMEAKTEAKTVSSGPSWHDCSPTRSQRAKSMLGWRLQRLKCYCSMSLSPPWINSTAVLIRHICLGFFRLYLGINGRSSPTISMLRIKCFCNMSLTIPCINSSAALKKKKKCFVGFQTLSTTVLTHQTTTLVQFVKKIAIISLGKFCF